MKIGTPANYYVRVGSEAWSASPDEAARYDGTYEVDLNQLVVVTFVDDVSRFGPPWTGAPLPPPEQELTDPQLNRLAALLGGRYVVTPNDALAGRTERFERPWGRPESRDGTVFYVTSAQFAELRADLEALWEVAGNVHSGARRDDLRDRPVLRLIEDRVLVAPWLSAQDAAAIGRGSS
jgi:hypothetical protein